MPLRIRRDQCGGCAYRSSASVHRPLERRGVEIIEYDAGAGAVCGVVVLDRIGESTGAAHDRHRAVAQAVHLVEPAGLVERGHEEQVARRLDPVRELLVVAALEHHPPREERAQPGEELLVLRLAAAECGARQLARTQHLGQRLEHQLDALLRGEAADDAGERHLGSGREAHACKELALERRLACEVLRIVVHGQVAVAARIPFVVVDAVQDPGERGAARAQAVLETHPVLIGADLARVGGAHGGDGIRVEDPVAQGVDASRAQVVLVQEVRVARRQTEIGDVGGLKDSLIADVVNGEHGAGRSERRLAAILGAQEQRRKRRVPVVAVQDLRRPLQKRGSS